MRSKGDVPVPYIIALVLGALVLGFIAYSLFYSNTEFSKSIQDVLKNNAYGGTGIGDSGSQPSENDGSTTTRECYVHSDCCINVEKSTSGLVGAGPCGLDQGAYCDSDGKCHCGSAYTTYDTCPPFDVPAN